MKYFLSLIAVFTPLTSISAYASQSTIVECSASVDNKVESMKIKLDSDLNPVFWSKVKIIEASKNSYFENLTNIESFGLEGSRTLNDKSGFNILKVMNTAESIDIAVHKGLKKGFYSYHDEGSGNGDFKIELTCKTISKPDTNSSKPASPFTTGLFCKEIAKSRGIENYIDIAFCAKNSIAIKDDSSATQWNDRYLFNGKIQSTDTRAISCTLTVNNRGTAKTPRISVRKCITL